MLGQQQNFLAGILIALQSFNGSSTTSCEAIAKMLLIYEIALLFPSHSMCMQFLLR